MSWVPCVCVLGVGGMSLNRSLDGEAGVEAAEASMPT